MLDFTSALYLGLRHPSNLLRPWAELTIGAPAALAAPPGAHAIAQQIATLQGCERATLAPSTLHLFWDLFGILANGQIAIYMDASVYPIVRWGVERAAARSVPVRSFPHHDVDTLRRQLAKDRHHRIRPIVVTDGLTPGRSGPAPIVAYLEIVRALGGYLILDDTQALGILGDTPGPSAPYGRGGGGSLRWHDVRGPDILVISSLAKGFGVPVAALTGGDALVRHFDEKSETRVHTSPPSIPIIHAAEHALAVNRRHGDALRLRLVQLVRHFRRHLTGVGFSVSGGLFPVQTLVPMPGLDAASLRDRLLELGIQTVLLRGRSGNSLRLSFILTARHTLHDLDYTVGALYQAVRGLSALKVRMSVVQER